MTEKTILQEATENCQLIPDAQVEASHADMVAALIKNPEDILFALDANRVALIHDALGIADEAGELVGAIKKHVAYNRPIDLSNVIEEMGDLEFYLEDLRTRLKISRKLILEFNRIKLLQKRFPNGYSDQAAIARKDKQGTLYGELNQHVMEDLGSRLGVPPAVFNSPRVYTPLSPDCPLNCSDECCPPRQTPGLFAKSAPEEPVHYLDRANQTLFNQE
jgi:NTP pyrophosphatase (non-canonical NTP hydrolase)